MTRLVLLDPMLTLVVFGVAVASAFALFQGRRRASHGSRFPPGPVALPLVGNILGIDAQRPWVTYTNWANRYGDIFMIRVLKQDIIVINSEKVARDLFERRSNVYSDRPFLATLDPFGWSFNLGWASYGDRWRSQRRIFHQALRADATLVHRPTQLKKARQLILNILNSPWDYYMHVERFSSAMIMSIVYDYEVTPGHDHLVELFERGNAMAMEGLTPEVASIVDALPFVLSLPEWFPGAVLRHKATVSKHCAMQMIEEPFEHARKREAAGSTTPAMALDLLKAIKDDDPSKLQLLKDTCATAFVAGAGTTAATLQCFMLAMLQHPGVQERAQAEIDAVVGTSRLPNFNDRPNLPYVEAVLMETLRLYAVAPLGIPHATTVDDIYEGFFIPKGNNTKSEVHPLTLPHLCMLGSMVVANIWAMHRNEDAYPESDVFKPERFFEDGGLLGVKSIDSIAFGFGRRVCPGRYTSDNALWAAMVSILYAFNIKKTLNEQGEELDFKPTFTTGVTTCPDPFPCSITPRLSNVDIHKLVAADI